MSTCPRSPFSVSFLKERTSAASPESNRATVSLWRSSAWPEHFLPWHTWTRTSHIQCLWTGGFLLVVWGVQGSVLIGCLDTRRLEGFLFFNCIGVEGFLLVVWGCRGMYSLVARILAMQTDFYWLSWVQQGYVVIGCPDTCNAEGFILVV